MKTKYGLPIIGIVIIGISIYYGLIGAPIHFAITGFFCGLSAIFWYYQLNRSGN